MRRGSVERLSGNGRVMKERILFCWSGGKDSALALYELLRGDAVDIAGLLTTVTADYDRVSMHGVRRSLVERQAELLGFPLEIVYLSKDSSNKEYESRMTELLLRYKEERVLTVAFGDIHLREVREYRERNLKAVGMKAFFPLWGRSTEELANFFVRMGFKAVVTCVDSRALDGGFVGRMMDNSFFSDLPPEVDPCGENGEYHSFVFDTPMFRGPIPCATGEVVVRDVFHFCDVMLADESTERNPSREGGINGRFLQIPRLGE
jgi:uncharacterized protein (TIGR00290 family)